MGTKAGSIISCVTSRFSTGQPETIAAARDLIASTADDLAKESDGTAYQLRSYSTTYADVQQHWVIVYSPQARKKAMKSVTKHCGKLSKADAKLLDRLRKRKFACEADALEGWRSARRKLKSVYSMISKSKHCHNLSNVAVPQKKPNRIAFSIELLPH